MRDFGPQFTPRLGSQRLLIPAYFYPTQEKWERMCGAIYSSLASAILIMNPNSGPGEVADPIYSAAMHDCQSHRQTVIGYVYTDHAKRSLSEVESDIDRYYLFYPGIRGMFVDEMSNDETHKTYYRTLYDYVKGKGSRLSTPRIVGNPGIPATHGGPSDDGAWQVTEPVVADVLVVFEGPFEDVLDSDGTLVTKGYKNWLPPAWVSSRPASVFANLVYASPDAAATRSICVASDQKNAGWIYVTQDILDNPWDEPPDPEVIASPTLYRREVIVGG